MKASNFEFRLRMVIQIVIVILGFWAPWIQLLHIGRRDSLLEWLALEVSRADILRFTYSVPAVIVFASLVALVGAAFRVWGAAYLSYSTIHDADMQGNTILADGPYRFVRNPLYVGGWFTFAGLAFLMPATGALFTMLAITVHLFRLILGEEAFLTAKLGEPYLAYLRAVPRLIPRLGNGLPAAGHRPHWLVAVASEITPISVFVALAVFSWSYEQLQMERCVLIGFGLSLVVRALMKSKPAEPSTA